MIENILLIRGFLQSVGRFPAVDF